MKLLMLLATLLLALPAAATPSPPLEGTLVLQYRNLLLVRDAQQERVVLLPETTAFGNFTFLQELKPGDRLTVSRVRETAGVLITDSVELQRGMEPAATGMRAFELWEMMVRKKKILLVDVRNEKEFAEGHLPGARSFPNASGEAALGQLLREGGEETTLVLYSRDRFDPSVNTQVRAAQAAGFRSVKVLAGGVEEWTREGYPLAAPPPFVQSLLKTGQKTVLVDVRGREPFLAGHLPGAVLLAADKVHPDLLMPYEAADPAIFYAADEADSSVLEAAQKVASWGYLHRSGVPVMLLEGGFSAWREARLPTETGGAARDLPVKPGDTRGMILFDEFGKTWRERGTNRKVVFLDVRSRLELLDGRIGRTVHIPVDELPFRLSELPKDKEIVTFCSSGKRSRIAYRILRDNGFKVRYLGRKLSLTAAGDIR